MNMWQSVRLTLGILKSLYTQTDLDAVGEGFTVICTDEEALKLVENSIVTTGQVIDMLGDNVPYYFKHFPTCNNAIMNGNYICFVKVCHAQVLDSSYHELSYFFCYFESFITRDES
jgi:hypothetical protein